jgi:uncharacterized protein DUF1543
MTPRLFAVYLGGRAPRASIELHDMVFVAGEAIEDCYQQILDRWFGTPGHVHIDSVLELDIVEGWKIELHRTASGQKEKLFFVNLGAYNRTDFTELHAASFHVAADAPQAKAAALAQHFREGVSEPHKDDLIDVDDCLAIDTPGGWHVALTRTNAVSAQKPSNRYQAIPKAVIAAWLARRG